MKVRLPSSSTLTCTCTVLFLYFCFTMAMFRLELPETFSGDEGQDFHQWVKRFEVAVDSVDSSSAQKHSILPSRLSGSAFTVWENIPESDKKDFEKVKTVLSEVFGRTTYLTNFRSCITARSRLPLEPIEVFAAAISTLVGEAFPKYDEEAKDGEKFRRFMAGLDLQLRKKLYEHGVDSFKQAVKTAVRIEQATLLGQPDATQIQVAATSKPENSNDALMQLIASLGEKIDALAVSGHSRSPASFDNRPHDRHRRSPYSSPTRYSSRRDDRSYHRSPSSSPSRYTYHDRYSSRHERSRDHPTSSYHRSSYGQHDRSRDRSYYRSPSSSPARYHSYRDTASFTRSDSPRRRSPASSPIRYSSHSYSSSLRSDMLRGRSPSPPRRQNNVHFDDQVDRARQGNYH